MKRVGNLFDKIVEIENLMCSAHKAFKNKSSTREVIYFRKNFLQNIINIREELKSGTIELGNYRRFIIYEPKERHISAAPLKQRIVHHAIMNICHNFFDKNLIYDCFASRVGKGTHKAIKRLQEKQKSFLYYVKLDFRKYFDSIDHFVLKTLLRRLFKDPFLINLLDRIIDTYGKDFKGIPIGNLTSQYFANFYISGLDHYMKEEVKVPFYIRYMDDVIILSSDFKQLKHAVKQYIAFSDSKLHLQVKPPIIGRVCHGIPFLGYRIYRDRIIINGKGKRRIIKKLKLLERLFHTSRISEKEISNRIHSSLSYLNFADSYKFRKKVFV